MKRALSALVAVSMILGAVPVTKAAAATPLGNLIDFGNGEFQRAAGANDAIYIDGLIPYNDNCLHGGTQDFLYPATDVYIVPAGTASGGAKLTDVNGTPNTIVATSTGVFVGEMIAVTTPSGSLGAGDYDVVYDNCQDGQYDPGRDTIFRDAVTVEMPFVAPLTDGAIGAIKEQARREYYSWLATRFAMNGLFKLADKAIKAFSADNLSATGSGPSWTAPNRRSGPPSSAARSSSVNPNSAPLADRAVGQRRRVAAPGAAAHHRIPRRPGGDRRPAAGGDDRGGGAVHAPAPARGPGSA